MVNLWLIYGIAMENGNMMGFNGDLMVKIIGDLMLITKIAAG
jgi:hypothetical protein